MRTVKLEITFHDEWEENGYNAMDDEELIETLIESNCDYNSVDVKIK